MNLSLLTDEELKIFLEKGIPSNVYRDIYKYNSKLAPKLKGFRPNTADKSIFVQTSMSLIKKEKNMTLIGILSKYYDNRKKLIKDNEIKLIKDGYPEYIAYSLSIVRGYDQTFLPIFFKLEGINEVQQKQIIDNEKNVTLIEEVCSMKVEKQLKERFDLLEKKIVQNNDDLNKTLESIKKEIQRINDIDEIDKSSIKSLNNKIFNLENNIVLKTSFDAIIKQISKETIQQIDNSFNKLADAESIINLQQQICELKKEIENYSLLNKDMDIIVDSFTNEEYKTIDDNIDYFIGDVIENIVSGNAFNTLKEYLIEIIYSNKPIVCSEKNAKILSEILSSIITGGNYYIVSVSNNCSDSKLMQKIDKIPNICGNKVIIIKNVLEVRNHQFILDYIKSRPSTEKYIFEISFDKEAYFMPIEYLEEFNFFFGNIKGEINYKYSYNFLNTNRKYITNIKYNKFLEAIGVKLLDKRIMNDKFYGILAYSIIPFVAINKEVETTELIEKLLDDDLYSKCEAVIHD